MRPFAYFAGMLILLISFSSCKKQTDDFILESVNDYQPLQVGKYIIYALDSTVYTNFGRDTEIHSYQEKHEVDAVISDNLGRPAYRIFRFLRDADGLTQWTYAGTYFITIEDNKVEVNENNLRVLKLASPITENFSWKGNTYLPTEPYGSVYTFSNDDYMDDWDFTYESKGETLVLENHTVENVITVNLINESLNYPMTSDEAIAYRNYGVDKYAKGIGLVYQEFVMWEYQPNTSGPSGYTTGFGIKRSMLDHN